MGFLGVIAYSLAVISPLLLLIWIGPLMRRIRPSGLVLSAAVNARFGWIPFLICNSAGLFLMLVFLNCELTALGHLLTVFEVPVLPAQAFVCLSTTVYTAVSGMKASLLTDKIHGYIVIILIAILSAAFTSQVDLVPGELSRQGLIEPTRAAYESIYTLIAASLFSTVLHEGFWQRVYSAKSDYHLKKSLLVAACVSFPIMFLIGFAGVWAVGSQLSEKNDPSAFFLLASALPRWVNGIVLILGSVFISSSVDTLQNGIVAAIANDIFFGKLDLVKVRMVAAVVNIPLILLSAQGFNVLSLFLMADLIATIVVVPILIGFIQTKFTKQLDGTDFTVGFLGGILSVILFGCLYYGNVLDGLVLLTLPNGLSETESLGVFLAAPFGSAIFMCISGLIRPKCQEQNNPKK